MNSPQRDLASPLTGLEHLTQALALSDQVARRHAIWRVLSVAETPCSRAIEKNVLPTLVARADLTYDEVLELIKAHPYTARDVYRSLQRSLANATFTLAAVSKGTPSPVHGAERAGLAASIRRPLIVAGYDVSESAVRALTYAVIGALADTMAEPLTLPVAPPRWAGQVSDGPVGDHDEVHWLTGEPLQQAAALATATAAALAALTRALATAEEVVAA